VPIYEYRCDCGGTVEALAASGAPAPVCPACGAETRKLVSGFAVGGPTRACRSPRCPRPGRGPTAVTPSASPVSNDSGSNASGSRTVTPSWQAMAAQSWPTRVLTRPSRCAPATPQPRQRPMARGPRPTLRAKESSAGATTTYILTSTSILTRRGPTHPQRRAVSQRAPTGGGHCHKITRPTISIAYDSRQTVA
jgi:putative FmdB family regulatory protein